MIVRVALDVPLPTLFDYLAEDATPGDIGHRVAVPFGGRNMVGIIVEVRDGSAIAADKLKRCLRIFRETPPAPANWIELGNFCADYYQVPIGEALIAGLPPRLRRLAPLPKPPRPLALTLLGKEALQSLPARQKIDRRILEALLHEPLLPQKIGALANCGAARIEACIDRDWLLEVDRVDSKPSFITSHELNEEQRLAYQVVLESVSRFQCFLLLGITGSGKTEVYLNLIWAALQAGKQALVLVPEISLTPSLETLFRDRFPGAHLCVQHSNMSETDRARAWLEANDGAADIVLGTRLGVFAPLPRLGVIVVDEEQDSSFKQQEGLRYSARDIAIYRGRMTNVPVLLCSATPSLESLHHARSGRYKLLRLGSRAHRGAKLPDIQLVDMNHAKTNEGISAPLFQAIQSRLERGEQSLVFLNRRGYAPVLACHYCGWISGCDRCSANRVVHLATKTLRCHYCGSQRPIPRACPSCGSVEIGAIGRGTQRVEAELAAKFAGARILRIDSDSVRGKFAEVFDTARSGAADILVGTQILAKGHHFERVTLVGVLNADAGLFAADYRAPERLFAQLQQVAGRAGRADLPGEVIIQTRYPGHRLYQALRDNDYEGFARELLEERATAGFPPFVHEAILRASAPRMQAAMDFLQWALANAPRDRDSITLYDPAPAAMAKLDGRQRAQLSMQSPSRTRLQLFLRAWNTQLRGKRTAVRWHFDIDPCEI